MTITSIESMRPAAARVQLQESTSALLLDVREPFELAIARVDGAVHIPLGQLTARASELPTDRRILCLCHHGVRSAHAAHYLASLGYTVANVTGGIDLWSVEADPTVPRY